MHLIEWFQHLSLKPSRTQLSTEIFSCADRLGLLCSQLKWSDWGIKNRRFIHAFNNLYCYWLDRLADFIPSRFPRSVSPTGHSELRWFILAGFRLSLVHGDSLLSAAIDPSPQFHKQLSGLTLLLLSFNARSERTVGNSLWRMWSLIKKLHT